MAKMNTGRVIQGGLLAGLVINVICMVNNGVILSGKLMQAQQHGHFLQQPRFAFMPAWVVVMFLVGIGLVWLYGEEAKGGSEQAGAVVHLLLGLVHVA